jgi:3-methyladenine DNA glycosylase/8-oxoguanine DNA glycosylase
LKKLIKQKGTDSLKTITFTLTASKDFNFWRTVFSHGWCSLLPFQIDKEHHRLNRLLRLTDGTLASCEISAPKTSLISIEVKSAENMTKKHQSEILLQIASCLRLTEDFSAFYREARRYPQYRWIRNLKAGRMLRAPSVFEDVVKMICTTNCSWALTEIMIENLVGELGVQFDSAIKSFPTPEALAGTTDQFLRKSIRAGYRSPYLLELAENIASGKLDVEHWRSSELPTEELFLELRSVKGVGPYAAGNILKLLGRYDYLGLDSWVRVKYYELHHEGRPVIDRTIEKRYRRFGEWRGLFFWLEMTKDWYQQKFPF